jgi:crossover junction endodeoxyribonuclease RuvC
VVIFGVDPGSTRVGLAVLDDEEKKWLHVQCLELTTIQENKRFQILAHYMQQIFAAFKPQEVAVEKLIWGRNKNNLLQISECRGIIKLLSYANEASVYEYFPTEIKSLTSGYGRETKNGLMEILQAETGFLFEPLYDDASDAMAAAWVHSLLRAKNVDQN